MKDKYNIIIIIVVIISAVGLFFLAKNKHEENVQTSEEEKQVKDDDWVYSRNDSKVIITEYTDFQCPACASFHPMFTQIKEEYKDTVQFIVRYYPLSIHEFSRQAAQAAEAAGKQGKYWEMQDKLFENQEEWANDGYLEFFQSYATELGLDLNQFDSDFNSEEVKDRIQRDVDGGNVLEVDATPTLFLNWEKIKNPSNIDAFKQLLDSELSKNGTPNNVVSLPNN